MPTVGRIDGLRVVIYPNDHRPAHVHVMGNGCEAVVALNCDNGVPELRENYGFSSKVLAIIMRTLVVKSAQLCAQWSQWHAKF